MCIILYYYCFFVFFCLLLECLKTNSKRTYLKRKFMKSNWSWLLIRFNFSAETPWYAQISLDASLNTWLKFYWTYLLIDYSLNEWKLSQIYYKVPATYNNIHIISIPKNAHNHWNSCCNKSSSANGKKKKKKRKRMSTKSWAQTFI